ncbi:MAG: endopeptidase La [Bacteroidales bacterium]|nr:endopeptidase La [Bacteroidales bacterium]
MNTDREATRQSAFSLIADYDGDATMLLTEPIPSLLPLLPLRDMMLFPGVIAQVTVGRGASQAAVEACGEDGMLAVFCQYDASVEEPTATDLFEIGVAARVVRKFAMPDGLTAVILQSYGRIRLQRLTRRVPYARARVSMCDEILPPEGDTTFRATIDAVREHTVELLRAYEPPREDAIFALRNVKHPVAAMHFICTNLSLSMTDKATLMMENDTTLRAAALLKLLGREVQFARLKQEIRERTHKELDEQQREYFLQQQIRCIREELGEEPDDDATRLREKVKQLPLTEAARKRMLREVNKLAHLPTQAPDYNVQLSYVETLVSLPWGHSAEGRMDIGIARRQLDKDHYGMDGAKERILEHLAMLRVSRDGRAPILCLCGPPGVGKTSLGQSIATALGRPYVRASLGGVHDEAEIRGHRRTYVGAMPGRIMNAIIRAGVNNPVFVLDEIDKVTGATHQGDPQSALLEVLDPAQNGAFHDNYIDMDFDLSGVLFIATANSLASLPRPLLDRMEVIDVEGYSAEEKQEIARRHLLPRIATQLDFTNGKTLQMTRGAINTLIEEYTHESGVRQLERQIDKIARKVAYRLATDEAAGQALLNAPLRAEDVRTLLGKPTCRHEHYEGNAHAGVATGLAWTAAGGEILSVEASVSPSKTPKLTMTGNLGDVMRESAMLALEYIRSHAAEIGIDSARLEETSLHVHVPEGATPKDGPSAGITIATAIASALTQRKVRAALAMTGEITLRGKVLPVGGIREKVLAARRAGIRDVIMTVENQRDVEEIPARYLKGLTFHYVEDVKEVLRFALPEA